MKLKVTPFHPEVTKEDPEYKFTITENGHQVAHLFTVTTSRLRANGGQRDYEKVAINLLNADRLSETGFTLEDINSIVAQLREAFKEIVA